MDYSFNAKGHGAQLVFFRDITPGYSLSWKNVQMDPERSPDNSLLELRQLIPSHFTLAQVLGKFLHGLPLPTCQSNTIAIVKKGLRRQGYSNLLFCFGGCRNGVTARSCLSRFPGIQVPQHLWSLAPCFLSGLRSCHCALNPVSPRRWCLSLLRHSICSLSSLWVRWKEDFPPLTWCYSHPGSLQMGYGYPEIIYQIWFTEMRRYIFLRKRHIAFHKFSKE